MGSAVKAVPPPSESLHSRPTRGRWDHGAAAPVGASAGPPSMEVPGARRQRLWYGPGSRSLAGGSWRPGPAEGRILRAQTRPPEATMSDAHERNRPAAHPKQESLRQQIRDGDIDTLIVALTDMQGRLMGKRVQGQAFLNGAIDQGAHFCSYLLGTDMEMNTPEGFALMNWETGYGDWIADPVWDTMRVVPWLEKTAIVLSDTFTEEGHDEIAVSPRTILKRQVALAAEHGLTIKAGS